MPNILIDTSTCHRLFKFGALYHSKLYTTLYKFKDIVLSQAHAPILGDNGTG